MATTVYEGAVCIETRDVFQSNDPLSKPIRSIKVKPILSHLIVMAINKKLHSVTLPKSCARFDTTEIRSKLKNIEDSSPVLAPRTEHLLRLTYDVVTSEFMAHVCAKAFRDNQNNENESGKKSEKSEKNSNLSSSDILKRTVQKNRQARNEFVSIVKLDPKTAETIRWLLGQNFLATVGDGSCPFLDYIYANHESLSGGNKSTVSIDFSCFSPVVSSYLDSDSHKEWTVLSHGKVATWLANFSTIFTFISGYSYDNWLGVKLSFANEQHITRLATASILKSITDNLLEDSTQLELDSSFVNHRYQFSNSKLKVTTRSPRAVISMITPSRSGNDTANISSAKTKVLDLEMFASIPSFDMPNAHEEEEQEDDETHSNTPNQPIQNENHLDIGALTQLLMQARGQSIVNSETGGDKTNEPENVNGTYIKSNNPKKKKGRTDLTE